MVVFETFSKGILFIHLIVCMALVGSTTHNLVLLVGYIRGRYNKAPLEKMYTQIMLWTYSGTFLLGALIYPVYAVRVKHEYFLSDMPWAIGLFEVKEHWAAICWALVIAFWYYRKQFDPRTEPRFMISYLVLGVSINVIIWYLLWSGYYLTTLKSV